MPQRAVASFSNHHLTRLIVWNLLLEQKRDFDEWKMCISHIVYVQITFISCMDLFYPQISQVFELIRWVSGMGSDWSLTLGVLIQ